MPLFDTEAWDGNVATLPESIRSKLPKVDAAPEKKPDDPAAKKQEEKPAADKTESDFDKKFEQAMNQRNLSARTAGIKARVGEKYTEDLAKKFEKAVMQGGLDMDTAEDLFFPKGESEKINPPQKIDPAGKKVGAPPANGIEGEWTREKIAEQQKLLNRMPIMDAAKWRREHTEYFKAEMATLKRS